MNRNVLVTGGAGFIGSHCVEALVAAGDQVTVLDKVPASDATRLTSVRDSIRYVEGDIRDRAIVDSVLKGQTHVLHLAALISVPRSIEEPMPAHDTNVTGTLNVFEAARVCGVGRVVYASSAAVYGNTHQVPTREAAPLHPLSPYGIHKVMNEEYAALYHQLYTLSTCGLRFFNVYGSRQDASSPYSGVISLFMDRAQRGEELVVFGDGSATRDFVHVSDVASACLAALATDAGSGEVFNVGSGKMVSINELLDALRTVAKGDFVARYAEPRSGDIQESGANIDRFTKTFGYEPKMTLAEGLQETMRS